MFINFGKVAVATTAKAALLLFGVCFEEAATAYNVNKGEFFVDEMEEPAYGLYYTIDEENKTTRNFASFDRKVFATADILPCGYVSDDWMVIDNR